MITIWDWLLAPADMLREAGVDPAERLARTGHSRPIPIRWAKTIGMWCVASPKEIIDRVGAERVTYDMFRQRHALRVARNTDQQIEQQYSIAEAAKLYRRVFIANECYRIITHRRTKEPALSIGAAASLSTGRESRDQKIPLRKRPPVKGNLGVLPIEAVLYYHAIELIRVEHYMDPNHWLAISSSNNQHDLEQLRIMWEANEGSSLVGLPDAIFQKYDI